MNEPESSAQPTVVFSTRINRPSSVKIPADLALYAALVGKPPEIDPALADPMTAASHARRENPWSPTVLSIYLRQICREKALKINKPELAAWLRRQSTIARKRLNESRDRISAHNNRVA